jgi:magnesium-protoporphyrin O-methyltransferase
MDTGSYEARRGQLQTYFDRTAVEAWKRLTSDAPVSGVRATVRAGRDQMRNMLLGWLPDDLQGWRLLDAGCGTGALSCEAALRGADMLGVDISEQLVAIAAERASEPLAGCRGAARFIVGDLLDPAHGRFDAVVAMDSLIHYPMVDVLRVLGALAQRTESRIVFTFAPRTAALSLMHRAGKLFPRGDRSPAIVPIRAELLAEAINGSPGLQGWAIGRSQRVQRGFYTSQAMELVRR